MYLHVCAFWCFGIWHINILSFDLSINCIFEEDDLGTNVLFLIILKTVRTVNDLFFNTHKLIVVLQTNIIRIGVLGRKCFRYIVRIMI